MDDEKKKRKDMLFFTLGIITAMCGDIYAIQDMNDFHWLDEENNKDGYEPPRGSE